MSTLPIQYHELETIYARSIGRGHKSIAITAADSKEGVSTLTYALARRSEAGGHKTLIVDLNMLHPNIGELYNLEPTNWVFDGKHICSNIHHIPAENMNVLPAPKDSLNIMKLRERSLISQNIDHWKEEYDVIIMDTSPLNAINRNNIPADLICSCCDATILVVMAGKTLESGVKHAYTQLANSNVSLIGTVINDQYNPSLHDELIRETHRLDKWMPKLMEKARNYIHQSEIINLR